MSSHATAQALTLDAFLALLTREGYLDKVRVGAKGKGKGGAKRTHGSQAPAAADDPLQAFEWRWGSRALAEVGEAAAARWIAELMGVQAGQDEDGDEDAVSAPGDEAVQKRVQMVYKGIERAAGGELLDGK